MVRLTGEAASVDPECLGKFESVEAYLRAWLEDAVEPGISWVLDHVDYAGLRADLAAAGIRYVSQGGRVHRVGR